MKKNNKNQPTEPVIKPDDLVEEIQLTAEEAAKAARLEGLVEALGGDPKAPPINKPYTELTKIVKDHMEAVEGNEADAPAYIAGDGTMFSKKRFTDANAHVKKTQGLKLFHCEKLPNGEWIVK